MKYICIVFFAFFMNLGFAQKMDFEDYNPPSTLIVTENLILKAKYSVLETADEYFPYYKKYHAYWKMYGLDLDDEVLKKIYYKKCT